MAYNFYQQSFYPNKEFRGAVKWLVISNVTVFVLQNIFGTWFFEIFGLIPYYVTRKFWLWQMGSYMFLHGGFFHIFMNLFVLWMFGKPVETAWGTKPFIVYYFICGIGAGFFILATSFNSIIPTVGASGAIYGILVAFAMLYPNSTIYLYFLFPIKAKNFAILVGIISFLSGISDSGTNISHFGHLGGLVVGYLYIKFGVQKRKFDFKRILSNIFVTKEYLSRKFGYKKISREEINRILDKILVSGVDSLTPEEKEVMDEYSRIIRSN